MNEKLGVAARVIRAADIRAALRRYYPSPECAVVFEVARSTGHAANRHLDAVAMDLWPSRGLALHGIEIKVNLYDWRREKENPAKAEELAQFCDFFWIAAPKGLIPIEEIPLAWGLLELDDNDQLRAAKQATKTEAVPVGRPLLAAMMRAATRGIDKESNEAELSRLRSQLEKDFAERVKREAECVAGKRNTDAEHWRELMKALGDDGTADPKMLQDWLYESKGETIAAIVAVRKSGVARTWQGIRGLEESLDAALTRIREAAGTMAIKPIEKPKKRRAA